PGRREEGQHGMKLPVVGQAGAKREAAPAVPEGAPLRDRIVAVLRSVYDPEIPVNIHDLGLVYGIDVDEERGRVAVRMTLTAPGCPVAGDLVRAAESKLRGLACVEEATADRALARPW